MLSTSSCVRRVAVEHSGLSDVTVKLATHDERILIAHWIRCARRKHLATTVRTTSSDLARVTAQTSPEFTWMCIQALSPSIVVSFLREN